MFYYAFGMFKYSFYLVVIFHLLQMSRWLI